MEAWAAWIAVVVAVGVLVWEMYRVHVDRRAQVTSAYLQRFWEIDDDLLITIKGSPEHLRHRHRYLKLCEDEFEAARTGILDYRQWKLWHEWLATSEMKPRIQADLQSVKPADGGFEFLRQCLSEGPAGHEWPDCPARSGRRYDWIAPLKRWWG